MRFFQIVFTNRGLQDSENMIPEAALTFKNLKPIGIGYLHCLDFAHNPKQPIRG